MDRDGDCTKCYRVIPHGEAVECFGTLYHKKCAPKNVRQVKPVIIRVAKEQR